MVLNDYIHIDWDDKEFKNGYLIYVNLNHNRNAKHERELF